MISFILVTPLPLRPYLPLFVVVYQDEDWEVYKFINKDGSDSEDESNQERLNEVEQLIANYQLELSKLMIGRGE